METSLVCRVLFALSVVVALRCAPPPTPAEPVVVEVAESKGPVPVSVTLFATQLLRVTWSTDDPRAAEVVARWGGRERLRIPVDAATAHSVDLLGPPPETPVRIDVVGEGFASEVSIVTPQVPIYIPTGEVVTAAADPAEVGWTLTNIVNRASSWPGSAVIYDAAGQSIWHYTPEPGRVDVRGDLDVRWTRDGTVLIGPTSREQAPVEVTLDGARRWRGPVFSPFLHHHFEKLDDGTYLALQQASPTDAALILDADHEVLWEWVAHEHLEHPVPPDERDFTHVNGLSLTEDALYVNSYDLHTLFKVDRATKAIVWRLGANRDFDMVGGGTWFRHQHDPVRLDDGHWLVYDNTLAGPSRVVEIAIDEVAMTAEVVWTFPGEAPVDPWYTERWFSPRWGDADPLPHGDVRVTNGNRNGKRSRIFDVRRDGTVAWAIDFEVGVGCYRSQALSPERALPASPEPPITAD